MKYEPNEYYARITEEFKRADGTFSYYSMLMGNGQFTTQLRLVNTNLEIKENVYKQLKRQVYELDSYTIIENEYGWTYERFVKNDGEDFDKYEIVNEGEHTDHEVFDVYIFYIHEDDTAFSKLDS